MAHVNVVGNAMVVTSTLKLEDIKLCEKYRPEALILRGGEDGKEAIFRIKTGTENDIGKYGAVFTGASRDGNGFATITLSILGEPEDLKAEIADNFGSALVNINALEYAIAEAIEEIEAERAMVIDQITIS